MKRKLLLACSMALLLTACSIPSRPGRASYDSGIVGEDSGTITSDGCSDQAKLVYVVDTNGDLSSFAPDTLTFSKVGTLHCPVASDATPFSMSIDRSATAWVLYSTGQLFKVSTTDASCAATSFKPNQKGLQEFGMGFASNMAGSSDETLFVAGGAAGGELAPTSTLASIDLSSLTVATLGQVGGWPELTGTGTGELWGFFPSDTAPTVTQVDKMSGTAGKSYPLPGLAGTALAWAFAFWGGDFYVFLKRDIDSSTVVWHLKSADGTVVKAIANSGRTIVGAGVSTCAPVTIQ